MGASSDGPASAQLARLQADARYARERYQLYKARTYGPRQSDPTRLAELERVCLRAETRLRRARANTNEINEPQPTKE